MDVSLENWAQAIGGAMQRVIPLLLLVLAIGMSAEAYTVVLKNGKSMTGTLILETEDVILFKDHDGIQYSLKKNNVDLTKTSEANAPKMETPPPVGEPRVEPPPKKKSRVYTKEDVDALREKYPEMSIGEPIENPEDYESGILKPEAYTKQIQEGAATVNESLTELAKLRDAAATAWEIAASTGKDPEEAVNAAISTEEATLILRQTSDDLVRLGRWQESMQNPPEAYKEGYNLYVQVVTDLSDFHRAIREWNSYENVNLFRSRLGELEGRLNSGSQRLQSWQPAGVTEPAKADESQESESEPTPPVE
jgi:hypothetical protein